MNVPAIRSTALPALVTRLAGQFAMTDVDPAELITTLKQTAFKVQGGGEVSDAQMTALLIVANQYNLNPWTKEIYAFPAKGGGIVPIVGVDGWLNIINNHPQFDGMEFEYDHGEGGAKSKPVSVTCVIHRKDRSKPVKITEFYDECYRNTEPWNAMGRRMLRNKAIIQCGRVAFSYGGIHDPDEGADMAGEKFMGMADVVQPAQAAAAAATATYPEGKFKTNLPAWHDVIRSGRKTADQIITMAETKHPLTDAQKAEIRKAKADTPTAAAPAANQAQDVTPKVTYASVADAISKAADQTQLDSAKALIEQIANEQQRGELTRIADERGEELPAF